MKEEKVSYRLQAAVREQFDVLTPRQKHDFAVLLRDAYVGKVRDTRAKLDPKALRDMNDGIKELAKQLHPK